MARILKFLRRKKDKSTSTPEKTVSCIGGAFLLTRASDGSRRFISLDDDTEATSSSSWRSSCSKSARRTRQRSDSEDSFEGELSLQKRMSYSKKVPSMWYYSSNHIMINKERAKRNLPQLTRRTELDEIARHRAEEMATAQSLFHGDSQKLQACLGDTSSPHKIGENVARGPSIRVINVGMLGNVADRNNMLDRSYQFMGVGTSKGVDGKLYLCQLFQE